MSAEQDMISVLTLSGVPIHYTPYALPEPKMVPGVGIVALDLESVARWIGDKDLAELERIYKLASRSSGKGE